MAACRSEHQQREGVSLPLNKMKEGNIMASCVVCKKDITTGFVVCGDCIHKLEPFTLSPDLACFIDQLAEDLVLSDNNCTCDMCSINGCSSQISGVTCKNGIKAWLLSKAGQFLPSNSEEEHNDEKRS